MAANADTTTSVREEYDAGAKGYADVANNGAHVEVEFYTLLREIASHYGKDLADKTVLDVACGEGRYTRKIAERMPKRIVGLDLSDEMITMAKKEPAPEKATAIEYLQHDLTESLPACVPAQYDLVTSQYLLCYAKSRAMLETMVQHCFASCSPGAMFINLTDNPFLSPLDYPAFSKYGFIKTAPEDAKFDEEACVYEVDGQCVTWRFSEPAEFTSDVWVWRPATYEAILRDAGFVDIEWFGMTMPPQFFHDRSKRRFLSDDVISPPIMGLKGRRPQ